MAEESKKWIPLESNPDVMNKFIHGLGFSETFALQDVISMDPEMVQFVPQPVLAVLLLFPISENSEKLRLEQKSAPSDVVHPRDLYYMPQQIGNACGTIALLHATSQQKDLIRRENCSALLGEANERYR